MRCSIRRICVAFFLATVSVVAFAQSAVQVSTAATERNGAAGGQVTYAVRVSNTGSATDSYNMSIAVASGEPWNVVIDPAVTDLVPLGIVTIFATVTIPANATAGQISVAHVTAASQSAPGVTASLDLTTTAALAGTRYVAASTGRDGASTCMDSTTPCKTITRALSQAVGGAPGDRIEVAAGTYDMALGEVFPLVMSPGIQLVSKATPATTVLDATGANASVITSSAGNTFNVIRGFTITGGRAVTVAIGSGAGMRLADGDQTTVDRNIFTNNVASPPPGVAPSGLNRLGGALFVQGAATITNNVFAGNSAVGGDGFSVADASTAGDGGAGVGGAVFAQNFSNSASGLIAHNSFYGNSAIGGTGGSSNGGQGGAGGGSLGAAIDSIGFDVANNMFAHNISIDGLGGAGAVPGDDGLMIGTVFFQRLPAPTALTNNLFDGNTLEPPLTSGSERVGTNAVLDDPLFYRAPFDLHVPLTSPAAGAGASAQRTNVDLDGVTRADPPTIGAYEAAALLDPPRLFNISTRALVGTGDDVLISGFVIAGAAPKTVVITATGPSLAAFGIANPLANPTLTLVRSSDQTVIASNDDWGDAANAAQVQLAGFAPTNALESAIMVTLPPGAYTAIVSGAAGGTGIGVVAVYEIDHADIPVVNISARGQVLTGDNVMIGGFVVNGTGPQRVAVVATGPSLAAFGIANPLANPTLTLVRSADHGIIASNVAWGTAANATQLQQLGFAPSDAHESAILITLDPGAYTAIVSGAGGGTGIAVIAVYAL